MKKQIINFVGGGAKGLISARILQRLVQENNLQIEKGTILAGTSTGAIIIALLSKGFKADEIVDFYKEFGKDIFDKEFLRFGIIRSKYDDTEFNRLLKHYLGNTTLGDLWKRGIHVIIPCYNATKRTRVVYRSSASKYAGMRLRDVVRASASAPTYFDPTIIQGNVIIDGGVVLNNPSQVSLFDAFNCGFEVENILCIGTGRIEEPLSESQLKRGVIGNASDLFELLLAEQDKTTDYYMDKLAPFFKYNYKRIDPKIIHSSSEIDDFSDENIVNMLKDANEVIL